HRAGEQQCCGDQNAHLCLPCARDWTRRLSTDESCCRERDVAVTCLTSVRISTARFFRQHRPKANMCRTSRHVRCVPAPRPTHLLGLAQSPAAEMTGKTMSDRPRCGATNTDSFELIPPSVADMLVMNMSRPLKTRLALKSRALLPVPRKR